MADSHCRRFKRKPKVRKNYRNKHHRCPVCSFDGKSWNELLEHHRHTGHRTTFRGYDVSDPAVWISKCQEYFDHLGAESVCTECDRHFRNRNDLEQHKKVHLDASIRCYGCNRLFTSFSAMLIHLESGTCDSGITKFDLIESAAKCFQWRHYLYEVYRNEILEGRDPTQKRENSIYPFRCPTCVTNFTRLSGLFQHIDSRRCGQTPIDGAIGKLVRWLERRHSKKFN